MADIRLLPIVNEERETLCYAYQDREANRELRMLRELDEHENALQFKDIFPEIREVAVCGCNELAYRFVKYLENQKIPVTVSGECWNWFGYDGDRYISLNGAGKMVVQAEGILPQTEDIFETVMRSASPEFECVDKIYEANVLAGKIKDAEGTVEKLLDKLRGRDVIILGTDARAQDAYDFLYEHGIDICCFAESRVWEKEGVCRYKAVPTLLCDSPLRDYEKGGTRKNLLGKRVISIDESIDSLADMAVIGVGGKNSALGTAEVEFFDYYGYERNKDFFLLRDYAEVSGTNLLHVLKGRHVFLAGDEQLCAMVAAYLKEKEQGDVLSEYVDLSSLAMVKETDILCVVAPWTGAVNMFPNPKAWRIYETLQGGESIFYTDYFSQTQALIAIDLERNKGKEKYSMKELRPKGILLGRIPHYSGNYFFRGILDGHPNILKFKYSNLEMHLLLYCIRLAGKKAEDVFFAFEKMYWEEFAVTACIERWDEFEKSAKRWLSLKDFFTSQELFMIFQVAYMEMACGFPITDLSQRIIYWEPHELSRNDFPYLAQWLDDSQVNGQTVYMHRDRIVRNGSFQNYFATAKSNALRYHNSVLVGYSEGVDDIEADIAYQQWEEVHVRFEDVKLHPKRELGKICRRLGIPWLDVLLQTTENGEPFGHGEIIDFDLKPVFNKWEQYFSEFDRFRTSIISGPYQKKYGYTYEDCMQFSRRELQEMFLKKFRFQQDMQFESEHEKRAYFLRIHQELISKLWEVRRHRLMDDIIPEFDEVEIGTSAYGQKVKQADRKDMSRLVSFVKEQAKVVLYGTGKDCGALLEHLDEEDKAKLVFSDLKAEYQEMVFHDRKVIAPSELCGAFKDYKILVTSSLYYKDIQRQLAFMGVAKDRIVCNKYKLWR